MNTNPINHECMIDDDQSDKNEYGPKVWTWNNSGSSNYVLLRCSDNDVLRTKRSKNRMTMVLFFIDVDVNIDGMSLYVTISVYYAHITFGQ